MKKKFIGLVLGMVLVLGVTACGGQETEQGSSSGQESQNQQTEQQPNEQSKEQSQSQDSAQGTTQESGEPAKQESTSVAESTEKDVWVPDEFVLNESVTIDFVAPAVHTGNEEQCTFMWNYTEEDLKNWFLERYANIGEQVTELVRNEEKIDKSHIRYYSLSKSDYEADANVNMTMETGTYNETIVHSVSFHIENPSQAAIIEESTTVLEMLGLGDCAEDIIHGDKLVTEIPTENDKGYYIVSSSYGTSQYNQTYYIRLGVTYNDYEYNQSFSGYKPINFEYWDEYFSLGDYLTNCEFDTSSLTAFAEEEKAYVEDLYGNTYDQEVTLRQSFVYRRYDFEKLDDVEFEYWASCKDDEAESGGLVIKHTLEDDDAEFNITAYGRQPFEDSAEKRYISNGKDLTDAEIKELCEARYALMKKLDGSIDWTAQDLINAYRYAEFDEDNDKTHFEANDYEYHIMNDLEGLSLYGDFEVK